MRLGLLWLGVGFTWFVRFLWVDTIYVFGVVGFAGLCLGFAYGFVVILWFTVGGGVVAASWAVLELW